MLDKLTMRRDGRVQIERFSLAMLIALLSASPTANAGSKMIKYDFPSGQNVDLDPNKLVDRLHKQDEASEAITIAVVRDVCQAYMKVKGEKDCSKIFNRVSNMLASNKKIGHKTTDAAIAKGLRDASELTNMFRVMISKDVAPQVPAQTGGKDKYAKLSFTTMIGSSIGELNMQSITVPFWYKYPSGTQNYKISIFLSVYPKKRKILLANGKFKLAPPVSINGVIVTPIKIKKLGKNEPSVTFNEKTAKWEWKFPKPKGYNITADGDTVYAYQRSWGRYDLLGHIRNDNTCKAYLWNPTLTPKPRPKNLKKCSLEIQKTEKEIVSAEPVSAGE